jgi:two-component system, NarL family, capsular synthesis sensor histidine kinase RcsC
MDQTGPANRSPTGDSSNAIEGLRVLYAEDHFAMQRAVRRLLETAGASVVIAHDGLEATERALAEPFDLLLVDLRMPRVDGFQAARALRRGGCCAPLVAVTADATPEAQADALAAGFDAVLLKPFGLDDLTQALQLVRERRAAQARVDSRAAGRDSS